MELQPAQNLCTSNSYTMFNENVSILLLTHHERTNKHMRSRRKTFQFYFIKNA